MFFSYLFVVKRCGRTQRARGTCGEEAPPCRRPEALGGVAAPVADDPEAHRGRGGAHRRRVPRPAPPPQVLDALTFIQVYSRKLWSTVLCKAS